MNKKTLSMIMLPVSLVFGAVFVGAILLFAMFMLVAMPGDQDRNSDPFAGGEISKTGADEIPPQYLPIYEAAAEEYNVPWNLLAAVHRVETVFSTIDGMESYAGAVGHMQFMPCTWLGWGHPSCTGLGRGKIPSGQLTDPAVIEKYGGFGLDADKDGQADPFSLPDSIYAAANYLAINGANKGEYRRAVFSYNHSEKYVSDVLGFMEKYVTYKPSIPGELIEGEGGFHRPLNTLITSGYGSRQHPITKLYRMHAGIDFDCATGDTIPASRAGIVTYSGWQSISNPAAGYGLYVWVEHGGGWKTGYAHLSATMVRVGDKVNPGDPVGACGSTGQSTGDHLHFEIFKNGIQVDPGPYIGL